MRYQGVFIAAVAAFSFAISCSSAPKPAPVSAPPPAPVPATEVKPEAAMPETPLPDDLKAKAAELRKKAFDYSLNSMLKDAYASSESAYQAGGASYGKDNAASAASFQAAVTGFQSLLEKGLPMLAEKLGHDAEQLRQTAIDKKAGDLLPASFAQAESEYAKTSTSRQDGDFEAAIAGYRASSLVYSVFIKLCDAATARDRIDSRDFAKWDTSNWNIAEDKYSAAQSLLGSDAKAAVDAVDEANLRYGLVWQNALEYYSGDRKTTAEAEEKRARDIKAEVAVQDEYADAASLRDAADAKAAGKDFEGAAQLYDQSATAFDAARDHAKAKLDAAQGELDSLDQALAAKGVVAVRSE